MCMSMPAGAFPPGQNELITPGPPRPPGIKVGASRPAANSAADVPLGDGMAQAAANSILFRRERLDKALADSQRKR